MKLGKVPSPTKETELMVMPHHVLSISAHRSHRSLVLELEQESVASHRTVH